MKMDILLDNFFDNLKDTKEVDLFFEKYIMGKEETEIKVNPLELEEDVLAAICSRRV